MTYSFLSKKKCISFRSTIYRWLKINPFYVYISSVKLLKVVVKLWTSFHFTVRALLFFGQNPRTFNLILFLHSVTLWQIMMQQNKTEREENKIERSMYHWFFPIKPERFNETAEHRSLPFVTRLLPHRNERKISELFVGMEIKSSNDEVSPVNSGRG